MKKSVISLISYDSDYLANSISKYYEYVDEIILGLDKDRITWNNNKFKFDENALWKQLKNIDVENKIEIVEENFHKSAKPIENDNYQRNFLKEQCSNDWIFSVDADEIMLNAEEFFYKFCPIAEPYYKKTDIALTWATPYKTIGDTTLVIANEDGAPLLAETQGFVTSKDSTYVYARWTDKSQNSVIKSPLVVLHWSLCRSEKELHTKINNTGHADIVNTDPFFNIWKQVTLDNYHELKDFKTSGLGNIQWPRLVPIPTADLENFYLTNAKGVVY